MGPTGETPTPTEGECPTGRSAPPEYWDLGCLDAEGNPWDPTDDIDENMLYFVAENTSAGVDPDLRHYWRWHTYDYYTGVSWGVNTTLVGYTQMLFDWSTTQGVADSSFWQENESLDGPYSTTKTAS
ncbi:MAG: hypothetical protein CM1200mP32_00660 [Methanobacteriota archaeon]|nr:MAG: hypothetical protein CM1200mP32_00660 [Euryarchaeota archaeon]